MEECILKNKNKLCPFKKLSVFYNSCLKTFGSYLVYSHAAVSTDSVSTVYSGPKKQFEK
jgi:hypothetical protein